MTDSNNYIVYEVRHNGVPIYIGSGKEGREELLNNKEYIKYITRLGITDESD